MAKAIVRIVPTRREDGVYFATWDIEANGQSITSPCGCEGATEDEVVEKAKEHARKMVQSSLLKHYLLEFHVRGWE
jgi:hypothetical protein